MRLSPYTLPVLAARLVAALPAPAPQEIDLDMVMDTPDPTFSQAVGVAAQTINIDTASIIAAATAAVSSVSIEISDVLSQTAVISKRATAATPTCVVQPAGASSAPTYAADADNAANFLANTYYSSVASAAPTAPAGYNQVFVNQQASNNAFGYLGFDTMDTYDVATCASRCTTKDGCVSINIYFERDPSVDPNDPTCSNPASVTMIKCVYWGGPVSLDSAVNKGQLRGGFTVAIAGSNGYVTSQIKTPAGFQAGVPYGKFAINAPYDAQGYNTFMGSKIFTSTWDVASCAAYCDAQTAYNKATAPKDGTPYKTCNFFNTYVLTAKKADGSVVPQGQYCALYTEAWPIKYATNGGQWRGQDQYLVSYSFGYAKSNAGLDPLTGDKNGAIYQARQDMTYYPASLTSSFLPYCSSLLGYTPLLTTFTPTATVTPLTTSTAVVTVTALAKRDLPFTIGMLPLPLSVLSASDAAIFEKRAIATPAVLSKYPITVQSSACGLIATQATTTSTITASTTTITIATQVVTVSSTSTAPAAATSGVLQVQDPSSPYNGLYATYRSDRVGSGSSTTVIFTNDRSAAATFLVDKQSGGFFSPDRSLEAVQFQYRSSNSVPTDGFFFGGVSLVTSSGYPGPKCQITSGKLTCVGGSPNDQRNSLQICPDSDNVFGSYYGVGPFMILSTAGRTGCAPANVAFIS